MCNSVLRYNWFETNLASFMGKYHLPAYYDGEDMLKSVLLPQVIMNKTENFHKVRIGRLNLWGTFGYELKVVLHIVNPFFSHAAHSAFLAKSLHYTYKR